ncbi:MAG: hypothetical protein J5I47_04390 [Vicingus serpentipes]|nr:hypothetical protein [Vicingus serpentipes]
MDKELIQEWEKIEAFIEQRFGERIDEQTILFIIGLQELGKNDRNFSKEEKVDIIHIGLCTVLGKYGYYQFIGKDDDGWPHFKNIKKIPNNIEGDAQKSLLKKAIVDYFDL